MKSLIVKKIEYSSLYSTNISLNSDMKKIVITIYIMGIPIYKSIRMLVN